MKGIILYYSATGNTGYVGEKIKEEFNNKGIETDIFNILNIDSIEEEYDFYVFGAPTHIDLFPDYYKNKLLKLIPQGNMKKTMIFSTQASEKSLGSYFLGNELVKHNFNVTNSFSVEMPNNFYIVMFPPYSEKEIEKVEKECSIKVMDNVDRFLNGKILLEKGKFVRKVVSYLGYNLIKGGLHIFASLTISVDYDRCIDCKLCEKNCPTKNIKIENGIIKFNKKCIACQSCLNICPKNAFYYRKKHFIQYKRIK